MGAFSEKAPPRLSVLRTIALYKLLKVFLLLLVAYGELKLRDANLVERLLAWASAHPGGLERRLVTWVVELFSNMSTTRQLVARLVTLAYAAVFAIEGIGLWMEKRWAEWLTVIITGSLIPIELYEMISRPSVGKLLIIVGNAAIVAYLVWHVRTRNNAAAQPGETS